MSDPVDELIKEIAVKHNIAVSRDDPIMVLHTINERLMRDSAKAQQDMLDTFVGIGPAVRDAVSTRGYG